MLLGSLDYRGSTILDFSPHWVIGSPSSHIKFDSLEDAKKWLDEFIASIPLTDEMLDQGLNKCDRCGAIDLSLDLFWDQGECETDRQKHVMDHILEHGFEAVCSNCYHDILEGK